MRPYHSPDWLPGHADYTPLGFTSPGPTTWAHQLATLVCFYSPFQCIAEGTNFLLSNNDIKPSLNFIKNIPPVWDETIVLPESKIGQLAIMARRKGNDWFLGVLNGGAATQINIDCSFLKDSTYQAEIFTDDMTVPPINIEGLHPRNSFVKTVIPFQKQKMNCDKHTTLKLDMAQHGGVAIWFKN